LATLTDPRGGVHRFTYDSLGRLTRDEDPAGGFKALSRTDQADGYTVTVSTGAGVTRTYQVEDLPGGQDRHTDTDAAGLRTVTLRGTDGSHTVTYPDGTVETRTVGPDPRFGLLAPVLASVTVTTPGGPTLTLTETRSATLTANSQGNPLSVAQA